MSATRVDSRGEPAGAASADSLERLDRVVDQLLSFRGNPSATLKKLLADDPNCALARCVKVCFLLYQQQRALGDKARGELAAIAALDLNSRERAHVEALRLWADGRLHAAAERFERLLLDRPRDLLALKLSQDLRFFLGHGERIRDGVARLLPHWSPELPGYGYLYGMYAFGLEECGDYARAEDAGRRALELNRRDAWAVHALAHVFEMRGERQRGVDWLDHSRADAGWGEDNFFAVHLWWHQTLFYFDQRRYRDALALYDRQIRARAADLVLNRVDAAAALWRLALAGVDVGDRAVELADVWIASTGGADTGSVFNDSHALMTLTLAGRDAAAAALLDALGAGAAAGRDDNAETLARCGLDVCKAIVAFGRDDYAEAVELLEPIRYAFAMLGGSHAQRDVYRLTLIEAALRAPRRRLAAALLAERAEQRPDSDHDRAMRARASAPEH